RILERKPNRLFLTHFGFSENPAAHIAQFRERLHGWMETTEKILQTAKNDEQAMDCFLATMRAEMGEHLPAEEVEQYVATAGLNLSFLGLARHARKRAQAASSSSRPLPSATLKCAFAMAAFLFARKSKRMIRKRRPRWRRKVMSPAFPRLASAPRESRPRGRRAFLRRRRRDLCRDCTGRCQAPPGFCAS